MFHKRIYIPFVRVQNVKKIINSVLIKQIYTFLKILNSTKTKCLYTKKMPIINI